MEDDRLAKWLAKSYDAEGLNEEPVLSKIIESIDQFAIDPIDEERLFEKISAKRNTNKPGLIRSIKWIGAAAASLIMVFAAQQLFFTAQSISTTFQETASVHLPDESVVTLNSQTSIHYDKSFNDRQLTLKGEAFFEVKKGSTFSVKTKHGTIEVLGTSFNVFSRDSFLIVTCATGKVQVSSLSQSTILLPGQQSSLVDDKLIVSTVLIEDIQNWTGSKSHFSKMPLVVVLSALSHHYGFAIDAGIVDLQSLEFTGSFVHSDIDKALKMVLLPFNIQYEINQYGIRLKQ